MTVKTFVVPLDGSAVSERALPVAAALAGRFGGSLLLVSAQFHGPLDPGTYLEEQAARIDGCPVDVWSTTDAAPAEVIMKAVVGDEKRRVCMSTHGRGRFRWAALGSVAEDVICRSDRPVLLVGRHCRPDFLDRSSHLLVCTDGDDPPEPVVTTAREWSALLGLDVRTALVAHPLDVESAEHERELCAATASKFGELPVQSRMLQATYVPGALADYADDLPAAIVETATHSRHGFSRFAVGSVTMGLVQLATCPVLVACGTGPDRPESEGR